MSVHFMKSLDFSEPAPGAAHGGGGETQLPSALRMCERSETRQETYSPPRITRKRGS
jgi:hypothetical protein